VVVPGHDVEGVPEAAGLADPQDALEAPVRVGATQLVPGHSRERTSLAQRRPGAPRTELVAKPRAAAEHAAPRPAPRYVDVVRQADGEARAAGPAGRLEPEPAA
jgi:hypothetical protein